MCGFAGFVRANGLNEPGKILDSMDIALFNRGPDSSGRYISKDNNYAVVHRRLAILDLSDAGHQPMLSSDGRYTLSFNGEIYNHNEIKAELNKIKSINWIGHSDTETLLNALIHWGVEGALQRCNGMFAFSFYDELESIIYLARDRFGEKPLYYGTSNGTFIFGSDLRALSCHPDFSKKINLTAVSLMIQHKYIPNPLTIYENYFKLEPATFILFDVKNGFSVKNKIKYWNYNLTSLESDKIASLTEEQIIDEVRQKLYASVKQQLISDVPVGCFLSGGIDSSLIAAIMQNVSERPVKTFTAGFYNTKYDEAKYAKDIANHIGSEHYEIYVSDKEALNAVSFLPKIYDEPFGDSSQIPTYLISKFAKNHVTVALTGDAGDELFFGYTRYKRALDTYEKLNKIPAFVSALLYSLLPIFTNEAAKTIIGALRFNHLNNALEKIHVLRKDYSLSNIYRFTVSDVKNTSFFKHKEHQNVSIFSFQQLNQFNTKADWLMNSDINTYLTDDVLVKVDRASMAASLETRVPMLSKDFANFVSAIPSALKFKDKTNKYLLKELAYQHIPKNLLDRPKQGFGVPISDWLKGPLKEWALSLLDEKKIREQGIFDEKFIQQILKEQISGINNREYLIWNILMFQAWLEDRELYV